MNTCLRHMVSYPPDGYCDRCGPPVLTFTTGGTTPTGGLCTCPTMMTIPPGQQFVHTCPQHGQVVFHEPWVSI